MVALTLSWSGPALAQRPTPKVHPTPTAAAAKAVRGQFPLTPIETIWTLPLNNTLAQPPAYDGVHAFFAIDGDRLAAYDLISGKQEWLVDGTPLMQPAAGDGLLFLVEPGVLKELHAADGSLAWWIPFEETLAARPVWDNGWLIVATARGDVRAFRATDGQPIWTRDLTSPAHAAPALAADRVYIPTTDHRIVALRVETGEIVWERRLGGAVNEILALEDRLFAGALDNFFYCVMAKDGRVDWRQRTGEVVGTPIADEHSVYFVSFDNVLRAMSKVSGGQLWIRPLPMRPAWGAAKAGATIVVAGQNVPMRAFNVKDGVAAGTLTGPSPDAEVAAAPHVLEHPVSHLPVVLLSFREIAKGASATLVVRSIEPALVPAVSALPNLVQIAPVAPITPPPRP